ncbi:MAG TPA: hypothetical protein VGK80_00375, partial [Rhodanobacteraceae bacterium]
GRPYSSLVSHEEFEPWWFHQQIAFDSFLVPFTQFETLLDRFAEADRVDLYRSPPALRQLVRLMPQLQHVQLDDPDTPARKMLLRIRGAMSWLLYRVVSIAAMARARLRAPEVLVFSVDAIDPDTHENRWIGGLHQALKRQRIRFLDVLWSASGASALRNLFVRRRSAIYANAVGGYAPTATPHMASDDFLGRQDATTVFLTRLAEDVLIPAAKASVRRIQRYERLLRFMKPRGVFCMDDYVHAFELVVACKHDNIPTVALQHGRIGRYTVGLMGYGFSAPQNHGFDRYCAWSDFFAEVVKEHSDFISPESVVVAGISRPSMRRWSNQSKSIGEERSRRKISVLFLGEQYSQVEQRVEVHPYISSLCESNAIELLFKPHPLQGEWPFPIDPRGKQPRITMIDEPLEAALDRADVVVASFTSAIFEAILHEKPVILFSTMRHDDPHGLANSGLAMKVSSPALIAEAVMCAARIDPGELARRKKRAWGDDIRDGGKKAILEMQRLQRAAGQSITTEI